MHFYILALYHALEKYGNPCIISNKTCQTYQLLENKKLTKHGGKYQKWNLKLGETIKAPLMLTVQRERNKVFI